MKLCYEKIATSDKTSGSAIIENENIRWKREKQTIWTYEGLYYMTEIDLWLYEKHVHYINICRHYDYSIGMIGDRFLNGGLSDCTQCLV